jgi:hypothetical protein
MRYIQVRFAGDAHEEFMVIRRRSLQSVILVVLSVFLFLPGQVMGTVLCIGADGHIGFEVAKNGRCRNLASSSSREPIMPMIYNSDHCGACIDVSLSAANSGHPQIHPAPSGPLTRVNTLIALRTVILLL